MSILKGRKAIVIGDRDGVPGMAIAACAESAGAEDQKHIVLFELCSCTGLDRDRCRLDHNSILIGKRIRKKAAVRFRNSNIFTISAVDMNTADLQIVADISAADLARIAVTAACYLIDDHAVTDL